MNCTLDSSSETVGKLPHPAAPLLDRIRPVGRDCKTQQQGLTFAGVENRLTLRSLMIQVLTMTVMKAVLLIPTLTLRSLMTLALRSLMIQVPTMTVMKAVLLIPTLTLRSPIKWKSGKEDCCEHPKGQPSNVGSKSTIGNFPS